VFRQKDIKNWWLNAHHDRPGGTRSGSPTAWVPESKPVIFTELGCPAVDKGANQPNVFFDPKSSESFVPHFSSGARDDAMQRAFLEAHITYWEDDANNPASGVYAGRMIETASTCIWSWDARMVPSFPEDEATWADGPTGNSGTGSRAGSAPPPGSETFAAIMDGYGFADYAVEPLGAVVDAVVVDRIMSARDVIDAIAPAYFAYAVESQGADPFPLPLGAPVEREINVDDLVEIREAERFSKRRSQEASCRPWSSSLRRADQRRSCRRRRGKEACRRRRLDPHLDISLPVVMAESRARAVAETLLHDAWAAREGLWSSPCRRPSSPSMPATCCG
jgi:hypothetical protein